MTKDELVQALASKPFRKLTGPAEHWLTTLHTGFWGLESKYEKIWTGLPAGDLAVFHATATEYLQATPRYRPGVIGVGIIARTSRKATHEWIGEIQANENQGRVTAQLPVAGVRGQAPGRDHDSRSGAVPRLA